MLNTVTFCSNALYQIFAFVSFLHYTTLEKGHFPETLVTIEIEVQAIVGPGQDQEQVQIETEFNVISVGNMVIS